MLGAKGPTNIGLEGRASAIGGDVSGVGSLSYSVGMLAIGDGRVDKILGRAGQTSRVSSLTR